MEKELHRCNKIGLEARLKALEQWKGSVDMKFYEGEVILEEGG